MDVQDFIANVQDLSDLELAALLCLIAKQHCLIETNDDLLDDLASELALIVSDVFGLSYVVLSSEDLTSIDEFGEAILDQYATDSNERGGSGLENGGTTPGYNSHLASINIHAASFAPSTEVKLDDRKVVNVVIAKDFNLAHDDVQIQALELVRRRRIFSRTTVHAVPEVFLIIGLISTSSKDVRLNKHLVDRIFISHYHDPEDGFPNLEEIDGAYASDDQASTSSVVHLSTSNLQEGSKLDRRVEMKMIERLRDMGDSATMTSEIRRYLQNIVVFLRLERGVAGGVSPYATLQFEALAKYLAPLHALTFVTPSLIALAAKKIYPHRILMASPEKERSMQYGSDLEAVKEMLTGVSPETVIEAVLETVDCPL